MGWHTRHQKLEHKEINHERLEKSVWKDWLHNFMAAGRAIWRPGADFPLARLHLIIRLTVREIWFWKEGATKIQASNLSGLVKALTNAIGFHGIAFQQ